MKTTRPKRRKIRAPKAVITPYQKLLGIPRPTIKATKGEFCWDYGAGIRTLEERAAVRAKQERELKKSRAESCDTVAPRPPIRYPSTWWDAVKERWVPEWAYSWGVAKPLFDTYPR